MEENRTRHALNDLEGAIGKKVRIEAKVPEELTNGILPCIRCYKFLNCWACENWLQCNERIEKTERVQCFECDGIGCPKTCRK